MFLSLVSPSSLVALRTSSPDIERGTSSLSVHQQMLIKKATRLGQLSRCLSSLPPLQPTIDKFVFPSATHTVKEIDSNTKDLITLHGHLHKKPRVQAKLSFAELRDTNGDIIQIVLSPESTDAQFLDQLKSSSPEDAVSVSGYVQAKKAKTTSAKLEYELVVSKFQTLNPAGVDAARLDSLKHSKPEELPPKFRFLQLRTPFFQNALRTRSKVVNLIRKMLIEEYAFTEIETPLLFKSTPEGAREFLVPTRSPSRFYALPQSPQQYKQILMSSGFTKYFQIARCFRDEDLRADRQPEFTQVDLELSFINNRSQVTSLIDDVVQTVWKTTRHSPMYYVNSDGYLQSTGMNGKKCAFSDLTYMEAMTRYGIDKPDLRSNLFFVDISKFLRPTIRAEDFPVVEACVLKNVFSPGEPVPKLKNLNDSRNYTRRKPFIVPIRSEMDATDWHKTFVDKGVLSYESGFTAADLKDSLNLEAGDVLAFSTRARRPYENPTPLGKFRQLAIEYYPNRWNRPLISDDGSVIDDYNRENVFVGSWVVDFPLFVPVESSSDFQSDFPSYNLGELSSTHHPFTMARSEDYELLESDPLKVRGEHYDLVINGVEVGGGSRRVHDPALQLYIFENILKIKNHEQLFGHLLKALSLGCPPHAGIALGFDRICAMLMGSSSIRDVIAFPKNQSGSDPVVDSPSDVAELTLEEYHIKKL